MIRAILAALALIATPALADETWTTPAGQVVYEMDLDHITILSFPTAAAPIGDPTSQDRARAYFPGLAGNFDNRSVHDGYWAVSGAALCTAAIATPDAMTTQRWGRARIIFDREAFPTGFTLLVNLCWGEPVMRIRGELP